MGCFNMKKTAIFVCSNQNKVFIGIWLNYSVRYSVEAVSTLIYNLYKHVVLSFNSIDELTFQSC